jgi:hypothetical protein
LIVDPEIVQVKVVTIGQTVEGLGRQLNAGYLNKNLIIYSSLTYVCLKYFSICPWLSHENYEPPI